MAETIRPTYEPDELRLPVETDEWLVKWARDLYAALWQLLVGEREDEA